MDWPIVCNQLSYLICSRRRNEEGVLILLEAGVFSDGKEAQTTQEAEGALNVWKDPSSKKGLWNFECIFSWAVRVISPW